MKILESAPGRYDQGIRLLTLGRLDAAYQRLTAHIKQGQRVLDLGCGTGALALRAAQKGARVKAIDVNAQMLELAERRAKQAELSQNIEFCEMGVAELGSEDGESYEVVMSGLCFSELTEDELRYTLKEVRRILRSGGLLLIADDARPQNRLKRGLYWLMRVPLVIVTYLLTQTTTRAVENLPERVRRVGFLIESVRLSRLEHFIEIVGRKPEAEER